MLGGVCGGLARQTGIDATWVRIGWVVVALLSGVMVLVYALAWMFVPLEGEATNVFARAVGDRRGIRLVIAVFVPLLIAVQLVTSALHVGFVGLLGWPTLLALAVVILIWRNAGEAERSFIDDDVMPLVGAGPHSESAARTDRPGGHRRRHRRGRDRPARRGS